MLILNILLLYGWTGTEAALSEMKPVADRIRALPGGNEGRVVYFDSTPGHKPVTLDLDIYLARAVPILTALPPTAAYTGVSAMVLLRHDDDAEPQIPGWKTTCDLISRRHHWYILTPVHRARGLESLPP